MGKIGCAVLVLLLAVAALVLFGGPAEPPAEVWLWGGADGHAPASDADAREVFDAPGGSRLGDFEARAGASDGDEPIDVALRGYPGLRSRLISATGLGAGAPGPWRVYRATERSERAQIGTFWQYVRTDAQSAR